jgi:UPF0755 protein
MKKFGVAFVALLLVFAGIGAVEYYRLARPYRGFAAEEIFVELPLGTSEAEIARRLADAGVVPDRWTFRLAVRMSGADRRLRAGEYRFADAATPFEVAARLAKGDVFTFGVTFPEGLTIHEMASIFERSGVGTAAGFVDAAANPAPIASLDPDAQTLEGYLFPSTYALRRQAGATGTVNAMVTQFLKVFDARMRQAAGAQQLSVREAVTLASLIEKETAKPDERPIVSAVYRNRLKLHMALQCDPTVIYALMLAGKWNGNITRENLQIESPYNTYRYPGLPPGPIASPGQSSLNAAVHPADVPYLYFVSRNDGTHVFASSLDEHNRNVALWQKRGR